MDSGISGRLEERLGRKVLTPVDHNGNPIKCENSKCEGNFDWSWTQHTAWRIDSKSNKDVLYLSVLITVMPAAWSNPRCPT